MLHILYIFAFTIIAFFAISNLVRSLITLSTESTRVYPNHQPNQSQNNALNKTNKTHNGKVHPELLDEQGQIINEPLLVMRSVSVEDARQQLDSIYDSSPSKKNDSAE